MRVLVMYTAPPDDLPPGRRRGEFDLSRAALGIAEVLPEAAVAQVRGEAGEPGDDCIVYCKRLLPSGAA